MLSIRLKRKNLLNRTTNLERKEKNISTNRKSNKSQEIFISFFKNDILLYHKIKYLSNMQSGYITLPNQETIYYEEIGA
jgi:hypothetical protein